MTSGSVTADGRSANTPLLAYFPYIYRLSVGKEEAAAGAAKGSDKREKRVKNVSDYKQKSFWLETAGPYTERPPLPGTVKADVCIIGGGYTGLSTAIHLKEMEPSLDVVLLESGVVGIGASGRNGGFSMPLFGLTLETTKLRYGKKRTKAADDYMIAAVDHLDGMVRKYDMQCDYVRDGLMNVATNARELAQLQREIELANDIGLHEVTFLDREATQEKVHSPRYIGAKYDENCALLQPAKLARELARVAESLGAVIHERTRVTEVSYTDPATVQTDRGNVQADFVLFATNAYSNVFRRLKAKQLPIYTYISLTEPLTDEQLAAVGWTQRVGIEDARNFVHYYRLTPDNRLLFGGGDALYFYGGPLDRDTNEAIFQQLERTVARLFPQLEGIAFTHHWGGPISASLDLVPFIGKVRPNILYSMGCMGHGVSLTNYNGLTLAELILQERTERTELFMVNRRVTPLPPEPLRYWTVQAIRKYLHYEDRKGMSAFDR